MTDSPNHRPEIAHQHWTTDSGESHQPLPRGRSGPRSLAHSENLDASLKEWSAERALLSAKADKAKAGAKIAYCKTIGALRDKQDAAKTKLEELKSRRER
jgi:hypothetical protein